MLKKTAIKKIVISSISLVITILICIFPKTNKYAIPEKILYVDELTMPIYVMDQNKYVARTTLIKTDEDDIKYVIDALTIDSQSSSYLPSNFNAIIPKNTKLIDYSLIDGLLKLNFSKEFLNVSKENEEKLIESLIFSLCELKNVKQIMIFVETSQLQKLPNSGKRLPLTLDKSYGINKVYDVNTIKETSKTTIYYMSKYNDELYYVPITKITNNELEHVEVIVNELKNAPVYETNLISYLNASYELETYEILENSITLSFNNYLLANLNDNEINEEVKYTLSLSIRDTYNIEDISINVN